MISFLFWNLGKNASALEPLARIVAAKAIDVVFLAECPENIDTLVNQIRKTSAKDFHDLSRIPTKVRVVTHYAPSLFVPRFSSETKHLTIWRFHASGPLSILLALVHLPSKAGGTADADQTLWANGLAREISEIEDDEKCANTVLVGDLNMNPFDPGMVNVMGLHGLMTRQLAGLPDRTHGGQSYRRFYNPMWGLFGDRTPGPPGTFFWDSSVPSNQHWHILDQVLLRPSLMDRLEGLQILDSDGYDSLLKDGETVRDYLSDHLPIMFSLTI